MVAGNADVMDLQSKVEQLEHELTGLKQEHSMSQMLQQGDYGATGYIYAASKARINNIGIQIQQDTAVIREAVLFLKAFVADNDPLPAVYGHIAGYQSTADDVFIRMSAGVTPPLTGVDMKISQTAGVGVYTALLADNNDGHGQISALLQAITGGYIFVLSNCTLRLAVVTADPAWGFQGDMVYRSDTGKFRVFDTAWQNLATETYVSASGGASWIGLGI